MNPSAQEILRSCVQNLEELVIPEVSSPHGKSALMCIRMLINHVILRLDNEGEALAADSHEKRALFSTLAADGRLPPEIATETDTLCRQEEPGYTSVASLTARNEAWKRLTEKALDQADTEMRARIRQQLMTQLERENAWCAPALDGPLF